MFKKLKIYLDTSVISYLDQQDSPEKMKQTLEFWNILKQGKYEIILGSNVLKELGECEEEKIEKIISFLDEIEYIRINIDENIQELAQEIINEGILTQKSLDDCIHIATAILSECNLIVSWNFKHLVNVKTINGIRKIIFANHINRIIDIYSPNMLLEESDENE